MKIIDTIYVNGEFVKPQGTETFNLVNPTTNQVIGKVTLGNEADEKMPSATQRKLLKPFLKQQSRSASPIWKKSNRQCLTERMT